MVAQTSLRGNKCNDTDNIALYFLFKGHLFCHNVREGLAVTCNQRIAI